MQAKIGGWQFPRIRCGLHNFRPEHPACCAGVAAPTGVQRNDDGQVIVVDYSCEFGHGWFMFVGNGETQDLDPERIVQDDREIKERWACRQCTDDRGRPRLVIWPVGTAVCPFCDSGTRYDCLDCGEQLCTDQTVYEAEDEDGFRCDGCWTDRNTVPANEVDA